MQEQEQGGLIQHLPPFGVTWNMEQWVSGMSCPEQPLHQPTLLHNNLRCPAMPRGAPSPPVRDTSVAQDWGEGGMDCTISVCWGQTLQCFASWGWLCVQHPPWMTQSKESPAVAHHQQVNAMLLLLEARDGGRIFLLTLFLGFDGKQLIFSSKKIL